MENPFKSGESVVTKIKGTEHTVTVNQTYQNEVQVKTADGNLLWRTMHTVWYPGQSPLPKAKDVSPASAGPQTPAVQEVPAAPAVPLSGKKQKKRRVKRRGH